VLENLTGSDHHGQALSPSALVVRFGWDKVPALSLAWSSHLETIPYHRGGFGHFETNGIWQIKSSGILNPA